MHNDFKGGDKQRNRLTHLENTLVILEKLMKTVLTQAYEYYSQMHGDHSIQHYAINLILYLRMIKDKYIEMYNKFISQLHKYATAVRILAKGYLPISSITPFKM